MNYEHDLCDRDDDLAHCTICNGFEASLPSHCPGRELTEAEKSAVISGDSDFLSGEWVHGVREIVIRRNELRRPGFRTFFEDIERNNPSWHRFKIAAEAKKAWTDHRETSASPHGECDGRGVVDSGGTYPWGEPAFIPCPACCEHGDDDL